MTASRLETIRAHSSKRPTTKRLRRRLLMKALRTLVRLAVAMPDIHITLMLEPAEKLTERKERPSATSARRQGSVGRISGAS